VQCLAEKALGQHGVEVGQQQRLDLAQHGHALALAPMTEFRRRDPVAAGLRLHFIQLADQRDEPRGQLVRAALLRAE